MADEINAAIDAVFEKLPIGRIGRQRLQSIVCQFMAKDVFPSASSGIVIAGFGEDEHFPGLHQYDTQSVFLGKVKAKEQNNIRIHASNGAVIYPFAQREMVNLFMEGADPAYRVTIESAIEAFLKGLPDALVDGLDVPDSTKRSIRRAMMTAAGKIYSGFKDTLERYSQDNHIDPIINAVAFLPKEDLAEMAESLVNLTSFKRRVTMDPETVGGPIDVAVISKGDGFIWIKRKHYFEANKNHHFFSNYFDQGD